MSLLSVLQVSAFVYIYTIGDVGLFMSATKLDKKLPNYFKNDYVIVLGWWLGSKVVSLSTGNLDRSPHRRRIRHQNSQPTAQPIDSSKHLLARL
jgi:hypothetical protein